MIEVRVADGYHPDRIEAIAGVPIRIIFRREEDTPCSDHVVFSSPRLERRLAPRSTTIVDLPPHGGPEIRFTCGMGRYRGRIDLIAPTPSGRPRLAHALSRLAPAIVIAALASLVMVLAFSLTGGLTAERLAASIAASAALVAAVVLGQRALVRPPRSL